jgi:hypothetical protein
MSVALLETDRSPDMIVFLADKYNFSERYDILWELLQGWIRSALQPKQVFLILVIMLGDKFLNGQYCPLSCP